MTILVRHLILLVVMLLTFLFGFGQMDRDSELHMLLKKKDSMLFDAAFDRCDPDTMESLFTEDFEFYHDKGGLNLGRDDFMSGVRENCAKRKPLEPQPSKRILLENSLQVFPLYDQGKLYGAIQHGVHRFEFLNDKKEYQKGDTARFTHVWILEEGDWKIKRELSYDHQMHQEKESK